MNLETSVDEHLARVRPDAVAELGELAAEGFLTRLRLRYADVVAPLNELYASVTDVQELVTDLIADVLRFATERRLELRILDRRREVDPRWFQQPDLIGYVCYVDRFADSVRGLDGRLPYLAELGVSYLHLMPLLKPRDGDNDGGYAVADYESLDPRLGTMAELTELATALHERDVALCIDLVLNHTAAEHDWARRARAGEQHYRDFYHFFPDRTGPDAYEPSIPDVFPDMAPGSFSFLPDTGEWVWTTFREFQWDLNYANPAVFRAMLATMLSLANRGIDVLRLDAVPFLWKRLGTDCQNQPEAHLILRAFRALTAIAAPGLVLKAEAIVGPDLLVQYLGAPAVDPARQQKFHPECDLAYDNQLMVMLWSTLATRNAELAIQSLSRKKPAPVSTSWVTYLRGHDDIGWAVSDADATAAGLDPVAHRTFLNAFYAGQFPGSFATGALFGQNPVTGDARISGSAASLCGIEQAMLSGDQTELGIALRRLELLYSVVFSFGGIPLIYMGDELALGNDNHWADDPDHANDNRWMHRPKMDWAAAEHRVSADSVQARAFGAIRALAAVRRREPALAGGGDTQVLRSDAGSVLAYRRQHPNSLPLLAVANFADGPVSVNADLLARAGIDQPRLVHAGIDHATAAWAPGGGRRPDGGPGPVGGPGPDVKWERNGGRLLLPAWGFCWLSG